MKIILKQPIENVGSAGEVVEVKAGYARNYLLPRDIALRATPQNMKIYDQEKRRLQVKQSKDKHEAEQLAAQLQSISLTATVAVGEEDKVFGSVTSQHVAELIKAKGFEIDRRKIQMDEPLKALGVYEVPIKLHTEVIANVKVWVVKE